MRLGWNLLQSNPRYLGFSFISVINYFAQPLNVRPLRTSLLPSLVVGTISMISSFFPKNRLVSKHKNRQRFFEVTTPLLIRENRDKDSNLIPLLLRSILLKLLGEQDTATSCERLGYYLSVSIAVNRFKISQPIQVSSNATPYGAGRILSQASVSASRGFEPRHSSTYLSTFPYVEG